MKRYAPITAALLFLAFLGAALLNNEPRDGRLEKFYELTKADPLFYDPTLELDKFNAAVSDREKAEENFLNTYKKYVRPEDAGILPSNFQIFPLDFLKELSAVIKKTDEFLKEPTFLKASNLLQAYQESAAAYRKGAQLQLKAISRFSAAYPGRPLNQKVYLLGEATSLEIVKGDFELILENAAKLEQEIAERKRCLFKGACPPPLAGVKTPEKNIAPGEARVLPLEIIAPEQTYEKALGPYFAKSGCWGWREETGRLEPKTHAFYLLVKEGRIRLELASENYYMDHEAWKQQGWKPAEIFLELGVRYYNNPATNDYRCTDLTYWAEVFNEARQEFFPGKKSDWQEQTANENKLWVLPYFFDNAARNLQILAWNQEIEKKAPSVHYLLTVRSDYSLSYLTQAKSVWRLETKPRYLLREEGFLPKEFETYTSLKEKGFSDEAIKNFNKDNLIQYDVFKSRAAGAEQSCAWGYFFCFR